MFDMHRLRLLRELAAWGTVTAAAEACSLTPSAVSQQLSALQREAGVPLLVRDGRRVILTEAARVLVGHTERILAELEAAQADIAALSATVGGVVRLAAFPTAASTLAPAAIAACRAEHPSLRVMLEDSEPAKGVAALKAGHIDVLLVYEYNLLPQVADPGIELTPLVAESLLAAVPLALRLPPGQLHLERLRSQPWIAPRSDTALRATLERACGLAGFAPQVDYTSDDYTVILSLVSAGLGVTLIPQLVIESASADLRLHPVAAPMLSRTVSAAVRAGSSRTPSIAVLLAHLREAAAQLDLAGTSAAQHPPA
ncbi:MAG TPA: LysR family transcriptional regulator [Streptosporangiaceae bacterium]|nr:LysR family transcriptional regulator [Streptosporangiaceae bacterium]